MHAVGITWSVSPDVRSMSNDDGGVVLDIREGMCYSMNVVGARVWLTIQSNSQGVSFEGIVDALANQYTVSRVQLENDIAEYLDRLRQMGLVHTKRDKPQPISSLL